VGQERPAQVIGTDGARAPVDDDTGLYVHLATALNITSDEVGVGATAGQTGGLEVYSAISTAGVGGQNLKNAAGRVYGWDITNDSTSAAYVKAYNSSGTATVGTTTPKLRIAVPASGRVSLTPAGPGVAFSAGIAFGYAGAAADNSTAAVAASALITNLFYK
jgi:hypothetical protein